MTPVIIAGAWVLDETLGEPPDRWHPVAWMGSAISLLMGRAPAQGDGAQALFGAAVVLIVAGGFAWLAAVALDVLSVVPILALLVELVFLKATFARRALGDAGEEVRRSLERGDLDAARYGLRSLCSRDAATLSEGEVSAATIESLAENASDSVVAPLFFYALFGLPGAVFYRAVNTADAMIGYHGETEYLGKAAARLDDLLNLVPARLTAWLLLLAARIRGLAWDEGARILRRDAGQTESPNAGWPMAAMAGLLGLSLEKVGHYRLGDGPEPRPFDIGRAWSLASTACALAAVAAAFISSLPF